MRYQVFSIGRVFTGGDWFDINDAIEEAERQGGAGEGFQICTDMGEIVWPAAVVAESEWGPPQVALDAILDWEQRLEAIKIALWQSEEMVKVLSEQLDRRHLNDLRDTAHNTAVSKKWHRDGNGKSRLPELLCLIHSEVSEVLECYRNGEPVHDIDLAPTPPGAKPEGIASELADVIIRVLDVAGLYGIDIDRAVREKMQFNITRPVRHGGKVV